MLKPWGDREEGKGHELLGGLKWAETCRWRGVKQRHIPLGFLSLCWGNPVLFTALAVKDHGMARSFNVCLGLSWEPAWHKDVVFSFSLG